MGSQRLKHVRRHFRAKGLLVIVLRSVKAKLAILSGLNAALFRSIDYFFCCRERDVFVMGLA